MKTVVGITGASGAIYGIRLLEVLPGEKYVVVTENGKDLIACETGYSLEDIKKMGTMYEDCELDAPFSSGSFLFDSLVVVPCSTSTLSKIACGIADTLITRCASVALKERRKMVLVPRETPLSTVFLQNMAGLSLQGGVILPAMPAFYHQPQSVEDLVDFVVGKILDQLGVEHHLFQRWSSHVTTGD
ncbi:MAG: UbiX family flavin prenyltransferase [Theionarchaea archaeon]|nr:UbiX family flavin prenyltransferase [Theionarchaea archaeon]MBU7001819.1 UbiX family flavin prenyltransferase [Theionarchaea archaeon]MBU7020464.1 UbiX family flavin prenyltransferase [Theionarchaea archaeon]MBU7035677.1 UbiX family flavin prenyltransferase [Theionarchaea archaeon]MBU7041086.1 UbiX family flavin prenyltransferase [Theionarchaea archaeon]